MTVVRDVVAYLPASLVRGVAARTSAELPWHVEVDGTMVMADLSGFTALSERLARLGDEGAERLTDIINSFFERMLKTASRYGGDTLTFGGDAILLLFDGSEHATRAAVAALEMLKQVERAAAVETDDGKVKIGMSVGAHSDRFVLAGAGLVDERAHLVVLGRGGELTAQAEAQAERGQLAVSASCKELLPAGSSFQPTGDYWRVDELAASALPRRSFEPPAIDEEQLGQLGQFLPPYARVRGENGGERIRVTPEHRRTVVVFVNILGLNEVIEGAGVGAAVDQLQSYAAMLTRLAAKHRGFVVSSDIATKGSKLVITFGAPVAHEYAPANAARFALDLNAELRQSGLDLTHKIGVNGGHVFAGEVGPPFRHQYTVMGDAVNLAARLMGAAQPGEALVNRDLLNYVSHTLCARELPPIKVKGKEQPVAVCVLEQEGQSGGQIHGGLGPTLRQGRLFGRRKELDLLARSWERARRGKGRTILIEGEAGVGKTRLLDVALRPMSATGRVTRAACFEHLQAAPFTPWVDALQSVLEVGRDDPGERRTATVRAYLDSRLPDLVEFGSLLNPLLNLSLPHSEVVGSLDAQARRAKLFELVARVLTEATPDRGHVVVVEDVHWMDESSLALAGHLARNLSGAQVLLLLTTRRAATLADVEGAEVSRVVLAELTEPESLAMVREALGVADLPAEVGEAVYAKTRGNPLFLEEVIHSLHAPGVLDRILSASTVTRAAELATLEIPDRVQGLLMSRIDRLPPDTREVLKAGAVVGRSFGAAVLAGIDDELLRPVALDRAFDDLAEAALVVRGHDGGDGFVTFRHALVQDVAYESLPFSRRRQLHGAVARYLESTQTIVDHALLVHHFRHAGETDKTRFHAVKASAASVAIYANREAVDYLAVARGTATARTSRDACLRSRLDELMGDSLETLAQHDEAVARYVEARKSWVSPAVRRVSEDVLRELAPIDDAEARDSLLCWKIAVALERGHSAYMRALRWLQRGEHGLPRRGGRRLAARMMATDCFLHYRLGRFSEARRLGEEACVLARERGDDELQAYASVQLGNAYFGLGLLDKAIEVNREAITLYERAGDLVGQGMSHGNLAAACQLTGDLQAALEHHEASLALLARVGHTNGVSVVEGNLGELLLQMGETDEALRHLDEAIRLGSEPSVPPQHTAFALTILCAVRLRLGDLDGAEQALAEGRELLRSIDARGMLLAAGVLEAELRLAQSDLEAAEATCKCVIAEAQAMGAELSEAQALCVMGRIELARGDARAAIPGLCACVELAGKSGSDYERARALAVLAEARASCEDEDQAACEDGLREAIRLFRRMGARYDLEKALEVRERLALRA